MSNNIISRREAAGRMLAASLGVLSSTKLSGAIESANARPDYEAIRRRVQDAITRGKATGVAVAVIQGGRIVWEEGFGWANRQAKHRTTPHTPFSMASITKPFTATTLMTLARDGKVSLDGSANRYLLHGKISGPNGDASAATVRMLGAHAGGLPGMYESYEAAEAKLIPSPGELLTQYGRLAYPPGTVYEYSNIGYAALHAIALEATGTELGALMQRRLLTPLGLEDSFFGSDLARVPSGATRYDPTGSPIPHYNTSTPASGELYASVHDLATFLLFNMHSGSKGRESVLSTRAIAELHRPVFTGPSGVASTFGWFRGQTPSGVEFLFKGGGDPGVANRMYIVPSKGVGCVVATNQSNARDLAYAVCDDVMRTYLPDWLPPDEYCGSLQTAFVKTSNFAGVWNGTLENDGVVLPAWFHVASTASATLRLGDGPAEPMLKIQAEGAAITGTIQSQIRSADTLRTGADALQLKLIPQEDRLVGRVYAVAGDPNYKNARLPYVLTLERQR